MNDLADDDRKARERAFHDERFADETRQRAEKYYAVDAGKQRYRELAAQSADGARVLEYGCGTGSLAFDLAEAGAEVTAIDISPVALRKARAERDRRGLQIDFREGDAEQLEFPDRSFDLVCGSGILHHLDIDRAYGEVARVLDTDGVGVFLEPLGHNPVINLYRRLTPKMRTEDERPLRMDDFELAQSHFGGVVVEPFNLTALAGVLLRRMPRGSGAVAKLHGFDQRLFATLSLARRWAWVTVLSLSDPQLARKN